MKKNGLIVVTSILLCAGLFIMVRTESGLAQTGSQSPYPPSPGIPNFPGGGGQTSTGTNNFPFRLGYKPGLTNTTPQKDAPPEPNQDIMVNPQIGDWMICITSYSGDDAHRMARQLVAELRSERYKLPAYVFNYGAEEQQKEEARIKELIRKQKEFLKLQGQTAPTKIRVRRIPVKEQVAVLVGGYKDMVTARRVLEEIRKLDPPDPKRVELDKTFITHKDKKTGQATVEYAYVNPFRAGFVVRNPALPKQERKESDAMDIAVLRKLNSDEPLSLLKCNKKITLAIREFRLPTVIEQDRGPESIWDKLGLGSGNKKVDPAAESARNLAKFLREYKKLDTYVLHTKLSSLVTVGGFESVDDPRLRATQDQISQLLQDPRFDQVRLFPVPQPMKIPH